MIKDLSVNMAVNGVKQCKDYISFILPSISYQFFLPLSSRRRVPTDFAIQCDYVVGDITAVSWMVGSTPLQIRYAPGAHPSTTDADGYYRVYYQNKEHKIVERSYFGSGLWQK